MENNPEQETGHAWNDCCIYIQQDIEELKVIKTGQWEAGNAATRPGATRGVLWVRPTM